MVVVDVLKEAQSDINVVAWKAGTFVHLFFRPIRPSVTEHVIIECFIYTAAIGKNKSHSWSWPSWIF